MTHRRGAVALAILLAAAAGLSLLHVLAALPELVIRAQSRPLEVLAELPELSAAHLAALPEARYFLGKPSVVVSVERSGDWVRVLTPARQRLPSDPAGTDPGSTDSPGLLAPAQTSAWLRADSLSSPTILTNLIIVSVSAQTLRIIGVDSRTWLVGVGAPGTPTPIGVTGYLEARYRDAAQGQGQGQYPVQCPRGVSGCPWR